MRSASSPGSTISARSEPSCAEQEAVLGDLADREHADVHRAQPSACGAGSLRLALGALLGLLAEVPLVEEAVQQEGHRHVEAEHQDPDQQGGGRVLPEEREQADEEDGGDSALLE